MKTTLNFGLTLLFFLFVLAVALPISCTVNESDNDTTDTGNGTGPVPDPIVPAVVTATKLSSTNTPSAVRDRYAVFNIRPDRVVSNYRVAIAPAGTLLTAADMNSANNLGVYTYDIFDTNIISIDESIDLVNNTTNYTTNIFAIYATNGINILMGFVYDAPILRIIDGFSRTEITNAKNHMIFDDPTAERQFAADTQMTWTSNTTATHTGTGGLGASNDISNSLLQPNTRYVLYGLQSGTTTVTSLLTFTTDPSRYDMVADRGNLALNEIKPVDSFSDLSIVLTISTNNYYLYPLRFYVNGNQTMPEITENSGTTSFTREGVLGSSADYGYFLFPSRLSDYDNAPTPDAATPPSQRLFYHSIYYVEKSRKLSFGFSHTGFVSAKEIEFF